MTMRQSLHHRSARSPLQAPSYPLLEAGDLPGDEDWMLPAELAFDDGDPDEDPLATLKLVSASDD